MKQNAKWIPIVMKKKDEQTEFASLQECYRHLRTLESTAGYSNTEVYEIINNGIDNDKPWGEYEFHTTEEARKLRASRKTRKR
ncbi:hypothetical protein PghCCS26_30160 [Paenibacillus glycanilyticus]|uniref:Uncharacterized protein n=1 Tax=Paenibacillus glycanilyticus TaxID=126569 RepID=A0ABQ6NM79_9BACL|nr:hypothetical protein [Paenibacillus glycanilyticus]GMK45888.1 hypothetical protein PghCCS26_30160 [Paenibacillus glycanilyticus]